MTIVRVNAEGRKNRSTSIIKFIKLAGRITRRGDENANIIDYYCESDSWNVLLWKRKKEKKKRRYKGTTKRPTSSGQLESHCQQKQTSRFVHDVVTLSPRDKRGKQQFATGFAPFQCFPFFHSARDQPFPLPENFHRDSTFVVAPVFRNFFSPILFLFNFNLCELLTTIGTIS